MISMALEKDGGLDLHEVVYKKGNAKKGLAEIIDYNTKRTNGNIVNVSIASKTVGSITDTHPTRTRRLTKLEKILNKC